MDWQKVDWYTARAGGFVAWGLVTASVLYGLLHASRATRRPRPAWVLDLHRNLAALACIFTLVHVGALVLDDFIGFGAREVLVPYASKFKPQAVAFGVVALYLLAAVQLSSLAMRFLPRKVWHAMHLSSYVTFALTTLHMLQAGTDRKSPITRGVAACALFAVAAATIWRVFARQMVRVRHDRRRALLQSHVGLETPTLRDVDQAIKEVVQRGTTRGGDLAVDPNERRAVPRDPIRKMGA